MRFFEGSKADINTHYIIGTVQVDIAIVVKIVLFALRIVQFVSYWKENDTNRGVESYLGYYCSIQERIIRFDTNRIESYDLDDSVWVEIGGLYVWDILGLYVILINCH